MKQFRQEFLIALHLCSAASSFDLSNPAFSIVPEMIAWPMLFGANIHHLSLRGSELGGSSFSYLTTLNGS